MLAALSSQVTVDELGLGIILTLRTYTHLMEGNAERTKRAIDSVLGDIVRAAEAAPVEQDDSE